MAIIKILSSKIDKTTGKSEVLIRFRNGKKLDQRTGSNIFVLPKYFKDGEITSNKARIITPEVKDAQKSGSKLDLLVNAIQEDFNNRKGDIPKGWLFNFVDRYTFPDKYREEDIEEAPPTPIFELFLEFMNVNRFTESRRRQFMVIYRSLQRFELYTKTPLYIDLITDITLQNFDSFLRNEHTYINKASYKNILKQIPESRKPTKRGQNTISGMFVRLRTFWLWAIKMNKTTNHPQFPKMNFVYGEPNYISIEERKQIERTNLCNHPKLAIQRDIFVFQCCIGCRVGDFYRMTRKNIVDGEIHYIARKTIDHNPIIVKVPLNKTATKILERYKDPTRESLLPFISEQRYNDAIKLIFRAARVTRMVQVINPKTGESESRPINEIAASHMGRRSFTGNLHKQTKDPALVGALTGHKEGSRAFARYRRIDEEMKREMTSLLD